jgi:dTDP-glucose 4,6-dehydratase
MDYQRIVVTGTYRFIGSYFTELMIESGKEVIAFDKLTYATKYNYNEKFDLFKNQVTLSKIDIANKSLLFTALDLYKPDVVVNFAAESHVDRSLIDSEDLFLKTNVLGVKNILDYMKEKGTIKRFIQVSTDEVGGVWKQGSFKETDKLKPRNPYSATKGMAELLCESYFANYELPICITRGSNTYGPRQYPEKLIPLFVINLLQNKSVPIYDKGEQIRDWLHAYDHANGVKFVLENGEDGQIYHIGGENERRNIDVVDYIFEFLKKPDSLKDWTASRKGHDFRYSLDCSKLKNLGWKQTKDWDTEIMNTIIFYTHLFNCYFQR